MLSILPENLSLTECALPEVGEKTLSIKVYSAGLLRRFHTTRCLLKIPPDSIRHDFYRVGWQQQSFHVRPTLDNREES